MPNTRQDRYEKYAEKAIKAMQRSLFESGITESEGLIVLRIVTTQLEKALKEFLDGTKA